VLDEVNLGNRENLPLWILLLIFFDFLITFLDAQAFEVTIRQICMPKGLVIIKCYHRSSHVVSFL